MTGKYMQLNCSLLKCGILKAAHILFLVLLYIAVASILVNCSSMEQTGTSGGTSMVSRSEAEKEQALELFYGEKNLEEAVYDIKESALVEKQISIYGKYNELIPSIIYDLNQCRPVLDDPAGRMHRFTQSVVDYGGDLETRGYDDRDIITVQNEKYWKAIFALSANDITALLTRLLLLMRDGELKRAEMILLYCIYDQNSEWERDKRIIQTVWDDILAIRAESEQFIEAGIREWDKGNRQEAIDLYHQALSVYPKSPWALYEISYDIFTYDLTEKEILEGVNEPYYSLIRELDPMYMYAYQGKLTSNVKKFFMVLMDTVEPSYNKLWKGEDSIVNMKKLADGYFEMEEYEFALYAYKYLLFHTYDSGFDQNLINHIKMCLEALDLYTVVTFFDEFLIEIERTVNP